MIPIACCLRRVSTRLQGILDAAEGLLRQLLEVAPDDLEAYAALGQLYWRQDRLDEALGEFEALATRSPNPASALTMAGVLLQAQGRVDEARERLEQAIDVDPEAAVAANNLAWLYAEANENLDRALSLAQRATAKLPNLAETHDTLGWVHYKRNLVELAIPLFEKSVRDRFTERALSLPPRPRTCANG